MKIKTIIWILFSSMAMLHAVNVGEKLPNVTLEKDNGGNNLGQAWHSSSLKGKVHVLLYMDPDKRKEAMPFLDILNSKHYDKQKYSTVAIVNLAATWMPDAVLETMLSKKQQELNNTEFIFDKTKYLLKKWNLKDDASNIIVCDKKGKILYLKSGKLSSAEVDKVMQIITANIK
ncbi:MAG: YtfJ family protein [Sulfurovum sp.]|nr:YtfJ family protein [Sulfurovum sp.]